jgi:carbamoyltransferase
MKILGISAFYHDSAAALVVDGDIICAVQEERFSRRKGDKGFPRSSIMYCIKHARLSLDDIDYIVFYDKPLLTFDRILETHFANIPNGFKAFRHSMPSWIKDRLFLKQRLMKSLNALKCGTIQKDAILFSNHHHSHAASAFYPSPFSNAAILISDGVGEWASTSIGFGDGRSIELQKEIRFPHSLGLLYSSFTHFLGFNVNDGEYKVMGLAPYGIPKHVTKIKDNLIDIKSDGSFWLNMQYFDYCKDLSMTGPAFEAFFGIKRRNSNDAITTEHMNIAASLQVVLEEVTLKLTSEARKLTSSKNLCLAGGVALNCVANGKIAQGGDFQNIWIQPASGDAGCALGAALSASAIFEQKDPFFISAKKDKQDLMKGSLLGPDFSDQEIKMALDEFGVIYKKISSDRLVENVASLLSEQKVVGWFQGRMEYGPRALGCRSILGDPRVEDMQRKMNLKIKFRESFRPFAPAVLEEDVGSYFVSKDHSPYMLRVTQILPELCFDDSAFQGDGLGKLDFKRSTIPAVTHVDYSARVQTVNKINNPFFYSLLREFKSQTGCSVLINTSFNVKDEPIVCSPSDAIKCFLETEIDALAIGNFLCIKDQQFAKI